MIISNTFEFFVLGGKVKPGDTSKDEILEYDTATHVWKVVGNMAVKRVHHSAGVIQGDMWANLDVCMWNINSCL